MIAFLFTHTPLKYFIDSIWRDEAFSYLLAKKPVAEILQITSQDFNPPLYYLTLHYWMEVFGTSEIAMRSLSLLFYVLGAFVVFECIKLIFKASFRSSVLYFLLFLLNPILLFYAFEARMYSMLFFFSTASFYLFYTKKRWPYLLVTILGLYTHYFMLLVVAAQMVYVVVHVLVEKQYITKDVLKNIARELVYPITALLAFIPWMAYFFFQNAALSSDFWIDELEKDQVRYMPSYVYTGLRRDVWISFQDNPLTYEIFKAFTYLYYFVAGLGFFQTWKKKEQFRIYILLICWVAVPLLIVHILGDIKPLFLPRYLIFTATGISLLFIFVISQLNVVLKTVILIAFIAFNLHFQSIQMDLRDKGDMKQSVKEIQTLMKERDKVYVTSELDFHTAQYYFGEDRVFIVNKPYDEIPSYVGKVLIPEDKVLFTYPVYPDKAIILDESGSYYVWSTFY